jgi:hypothetical protein
MGTTNTEASQDLTATHDSLGHLLNLASALVV